MLAKTGTMADVYREFERMQEIAGRAERFINNRPTANMEAEVSEHDIAAWYLVTTFPGDDNRARRWLSRRRFGVFQPMMQRQVARSDGQPIGGMEAIFAGWLFVYVFNVKKLRYRILSTPGVFGILSDPVTLNPVPIEDEFVQRLREYAWDYCPGLVAVQQSIDRREAQLRKMSTKPKGRPCKKKRERIKKARKAAARLARAVAGAPASEAVKMLQAALTESGHRVTNLAAPVAGSSSGRAS